MTLGNKVLYVVCMFYDEAINHVYFHAEEYCQCNMC